MSQHQLVDLSNMIEHVLKYGSRGFASNYRSNLLTSETTIQPAIQCLMEFWKHGVHFIHRVSVTAILEQMCSILPLPIPILTHSKRLSCFASLIPYIVEYAFSFLAYHEVMKS